MLQSWKIWTPLVSLTLIGCAGDAELASSQKPVVGGEPTQGFPAVVALYAKEPGAERGSLCTATVIAPDKLLTAAHCVHPELVGASAEFSVFLGSDITNPENRGPAVPVAATHFDEAFDRNNVMNGHDIAVVDLAQPVDIEPVPYMTDPMGQNLVGQPARLVGYGLNDGFNQQGAGIKRTAVVALNSFDDKLVKTGQFGTTICNGDSGGPILMNVDGTDTIVGVNSFGFIFCMLEASSTRVDRYVDFIESHLD